MRSIVRCAALLLAVAAAGCASTTYQPSTIEAVGALDRVQTQARNGLEVRATVLSPQETERLFGADLADKHIQPVWLDIRNDTDQRYLFFPRSLAQKNVKLEFEGRYWFTDMRGDMKITENDVGTDIDLKDDLDIKDEGYSELRFTWYTGRKSRIRVAYTQVAYEGDANLQRTIEFDGTTYNAGTRVLTDLDIKALESDGPGNLSILTTGFSSLGR